MPQGTKSARLALAGPASRRDRRNLLQFGYRRHQGPAVVGFWRGKHICCDAFLDYAAVPHHDHALAHQANDLDVMRDQKVRKAEFMSQTV